MERNNMAIIGVAAVVIAACLLFSFVQYDDGEDTPVPGLGSYQVSLYSYHEDGSDPYQCILTRTIVGIDGDDVTIREDYGTGSYDYTAAADSLFLWKEGLELSAEDEPVLVPTGETIVCDIYTGFYGDLYCVDCRVDGASIYSQFVGDGYAETYYTLENTMHDEPPSYSGNTVDGPEAGDFFSFYLTYSDGSTELVMMTVESVEGETVTYYNGFLGQSVTCSVGNFHSFGTDESYTAGGQYLVSTPYGDIKCDRYWMSYDGITEYLYICPDDGVCYGAEMVDEAGETIFSGSMVFSTMVSGDFHLDGIQEPEAGDFEVNIYTYTDPEGNVSYSYQESRVESIIDGEIMVHCYFDGKFEHIHYESFNTDPVGDVVGEETLNTIYGPMDCDIISHTDSDGNAVLSWVCDGIVFKRTTTYADGSVEDYRVVYNTTAELPPTYTYNYNTQQVVPGTWLTLYCESDDGSETLKATVESVEGDVVNFDDGNSTHVFNVLNGYGEDEEPELVGQMIRDTVWGEVICDVYRNPAEDSIEYIFIGAENGLHYATEVFYLDGSFLFMELTGSSMVY